MEENKEMLELDIKGLMSFVLQKSWIIALAAVALAAMAFGYAKFFITPMYSASVRFYVNNIYKDDQQQIEIEAGQLTAASYLAESYVIILYGRPVINAVLEEAKLQDKYSVEQMKSMVTAQIINQTEIFEVTVTGVDSKEVTDIANVFVKVLPDSLKEVVEGSDVRMVDYAVENQTIVSPSYKNYFIFGGLLGALIAVVALLLREFLNDYIDSEEYLTAIYGDIPLLAVVPDAQEPKNGNYRKYKNYYKRYYRSYYNSGKKSTNGGKRA